MRRLLDTNICIAYLNGTDDAVRDKLLGFRPSELVLCSVVKAELLYGARNSARVAHNLDRLTPFFAPMASLPFDDRAADHYGQIRAQLGASGTPIGANDLLIASICLAHDATLVTRNVREFSTVSGLRVERW